ncbi:hypothetical protein GCM10010401_07910 [Rarobacter faecitabidus]|uniref:Uncharacterized protein DUF4235 n=1 Tax=Rarobacter faecitabidus TaxID=13243 RepID=A0A542ZAM6_RARFA|nr:DUF4235 domain-containing protein [Rarobacter faecitabidus]TQL57398.1 uncharacterized protein DUF4235 [Rarobacter faecitabidus]
MSEDTVSEETEETDTIGFKIVTGVAALAAGWVAQKTLTTAWKSITGNDAPEDPDDDTASTVAVVIFAATAGAVSALARVIATRSVRKVAARSAARR